MSLRNSADRYGSVAQALHWAVVALILVQVTLAFVAKSLPLSPAKVGVIANHKSFGITILTVATIRLLWRLVNRPPPPPPMPAWQLVASRISHFGLYALLFAMPLTGWLMSSAANYPVSWFGFAQLPDLIAPDGVLKQELIAIHHLLAKVLIGLAIVHVLAALKHQFVDRDNLLYRMLPWRPRG